MNYDDFEVVSNGEPPRTLMPYSSSSDDETTDDVEETDSQASEALLSRKDDQFAGLEDMRILFTDEHEHSVNSVQVSNCNSSFLCNRDISNPQPITVIHPLNLDLQTGGCVEGKKDMEEVTRGALVETGVNGVGKKIN